MPDDLKLIQIWETSTHATGYLADAIRDRRTDKTKDITKDLGEALIRLNKSTAEIQQLLATSRP